MYLTDLFNLGIILYVFWDPNFKFQLASMAYTSRDANA